MAFELWNFEELIPGTKYGGWRIIHGPVRIKGFGHQYFCECECGLQKLIRKNGLVNRPNPYCRKCSYDRLRLDIPIGTVSHDLKILSLERKYIGYTLHVLCECICGRNEWIHKGNFLNGRTRYCKACAKLPTNAYPEEIPFDYVSREQAARFLGRSAHYISYWEGIKFFPKAHEFNSRKFYLKSDLISFKNKLDHEEIIGTENNPSEQI